MGLDTRSNTTYGVYPCGVKVTYPTRGGGVVIECHGHKLSDVHSLESHVRFAHVYHISVLVPYTLNLFWSHKPSQVNDLHLVSPNSLLTRALGFGRLGSGAEYHMSMGIVSDDEFLASLTSLNIKSDGIIEHARVVPSESIPEEIDPEPQPEDKVPSVSVVSQLHPFSQSRGRKNGDMNVPDALRKIIGETAVIDGREAAIELASDFGISPSSVSAYAKGATSTTTYNQPKESIVAHINKSRYRAVKRASKTMNAALGSITQDKLDYADAKDLSTIAKDMSVIIKNLEPQATPQSVDSTRTPQFVIYAPQFRSEQSFDVITVNE